MQIKHATLPLVMATLVIIAIMYFQVYNAMQQDKRLEKQEVTMQSIHNDIQDLTRRIDRILLTLENDNVADNTTDNATVK